MGHCTMPRAFGIRKWLEERFDPYFLNHDIGYAEAVKTRYKLDCELAGCILFDGYITLSLVILLVTRIAGFTHYGRSK